MHKVVNNPVFCTAFAIIVTVLLIYTAFLPNNYPLLNGFLIGVLWAQIVDIWRLHRQMKKLSARFDELIDKAELFKEGATEKEKSMIDDHVSKLKEWKI